MMNPINNNVVLDITEFIDEEENGVKERKTESGIILPNKVMPNKSKLMTVEVVSISDDIKKSKVKEGDRVLVSKYFGHRLDLDGKTYAIVEYNTILAVFPKETK